MVHRGGCHPALPRLPIKQGPYCALHLLAIARPQPGLRSEGFSPIEPYFPTAFSSSTILAAPAWPQHSFAPKAFPSDAEGSAEPQRRGFANSSVMNKGARDFWEPSLALVPSPRRNDGIHGFEGGSSSWLRHVGFAAARFG